eukprot:gnl/MRDRNA2_/MRDRNA2_132382_c0_seq1.p1 gnl/MRDRNA2_/MRDRNA2_132382_c0~~gnl/MRDRNA2_/MRDRNA2_132382_c0_seq1.p1  ORF type:complete len:451 (-),score=76.88 gnl/MRDRNA2_/MRDRNA2_132382_c0_seq1:674-1975(-)
MSVPRVHTSTSMIIWLAVVANVAARDLMLRHSAHIQDSTGELANKLDNRLAIPVHDAFPIHHANVDSTMLGKPRYQEVPFVSRAAPSHANGGHGFLMPNRGPLSHGPMLTANGPHQQRRQLFTATQALLVPQALERSKQKEEEGMPQLTHEWFNPVDKFGPLKGAQGKTAPLLLYVPGNDGSGLTPVMQFPELASAFDIQCLSFEGRDRSNFTKIKAIVKAKLREAKQKGREVYLMGESFGGIVALAIGMDDSEPAVMPDRIVLVNAASCFDRTLLGRLAPGLVRLPEPFFTLAVFPVVFMVLDVDMFRNIGKAVFSGHVPSIIDSEDRQAFVKRVFPKVMQKMRLDSNDLKWRIQNWVLPGCKEVNHRLHDVKVPVLAVAGTDDLLLPSFEEGHKFKDEIPNCTLRLVQGAGHAGVLDQRANLLEMIRTCWA